MWSKIFKIFTNKYVITSLLFIVWILFFDRNNLLSQFSNKQKLKTLQVDRDYYSDEIKRNSADLKELDDNVKSLEKFAREKYLMKRENEDIFLIVREPKAVAKEKKQE